MGNSFTFVIMDNRKEGLRMQLLHYMFLSWHKQFFVFTTLLVIISSCTSPRYLGRTSVPSDFLNHPAIFDTHAGIAIYDLQSKDYLYEYNSGKFFVPASNAKIATCMQD
jgi:D-alanyl-D-alanine carboxypeptidase